MSIAALVNVVIVILLMKIITIYKTETRACDKRFTS